ncbi:MAG: precorrin-6y C5,15-methyltransferase (decarboxylating) subunit CbiE [Hyphomicrobiaceae bacterium]|nr:precorrin-6y C5,15-methyltransferase (decarboxylating) subunit CbiE [Hyphomicrobiaceae bacterium]MCC0008399.1 precorrin-6y C5,15-methyltransferase (decarboxylating) subunit CbiE [Hyphomicrobiaceae bacterium]
MSESPVRPWLSIIGIGEDGLAGLTLASRNALDAAEVVFGGARHLELACAGERGRPWSVPFDTAPVLAMRGRKVAVLASGDPFWFGAGGSLAGHLTSGEWVAYPVPSTFSLAAARLGWRLEETVCLGLHAAPFERLVPVLSAGARVICLLRDGEAIGALCQWFDRHGWGETTVIALSALGGPNESIVSFTANAGSPPRCKAPVAVALEAKGRRGLSRAVGLPDDLFIHDGQISKRHSRALALAALAPRPGEILWDIGAGSGSISVEWALADGIAVAVEQQSARIENIRKNAAAFGLSHRISVVEGSSPQMLAGLPPPDAVFVGGGLTAEHFQAIWTLLRNGTRFVAHAVSLETQALVTGLHASHGGDLVRFEMSHAEPLGRMRSWQAVRPIVQWTTTK